MPPSLPIPRPLSVMRHATPSLLPTTAASSRSSLSTSARLLYRQNPVPNSDLPIPSATAKAPEIPVYPYGPRQVYKQANTGLYGQQRIRFGNNVAPAHGPNKDRTGVKTRRKWRVNVHHKRLWSDALATFVRTRVTTGVLRTIDKDGGLDNYLLAHKPSRVKDLGPWGWRLRWRLMQTPAVQARLAAERERLGLPPRVVEGVHQDAAVVGAEELATEGIQSELQDQGLSAQDLGDIMQTTDAMLKQEEEFVLGEEAEEELREERTNRGFMHEENPKN